MTATANSNTAQETIAYELHGNCYLNITNHCTLRCAFCPKFNKQWEVQGYPLRIHHEPSSGELLDAIGDPRCYHEVVFCGLGEPTLRMQVLLDVAQRIKAQGGRVRVNTDGLASLYHQRDVSAEFAGRVDAMSISLNAQNARVYEQHCRPQLDGAYTALLDFIDEVRHHVPEVSLTAIHGLPGVDIEACRQIADRFQLPFRQRELDQVG